MADQTVAVACDHAGLELKEALKALLEESGCPPMDLGARDATPVDYPDVARLLCEAVGSGAVSRGILVCGTGIGMSIAANRYPHIRAALCSSPTEARLCREHNDANVLVLGARTTGVETARDCLRAFLATGFEGGRHGPRVDKLSAVPSCGPAANGNRR